MFHLETETVEYITFFLGIYIYIKCNMHNMVEGNKMYIDQIAHLKNSSNQ